MKIIAHVEHFEFCFGLFHRIFFPPFSLFPLLLTLGAKFHRFQNFGRL